MFDRMRDAIVVPRGTDEVVIPLDALEGFASRRLDPADALSLVAEEAGRLRRAANATPADDGVVTLTKSILLERSWTFDAYQDA